jgi:hypothetical protein
LALIEPKNNGRGSMTDEGAMVLKSHPDTPYMNNRTGIAAAVYHAMVAASPSPELGEATDNRIAELEAENQALRADAERYRFVRVKACIIGGEFQILNMPSAGSEWRQKYDAAEQLDAAIDAAKGVDRG